jgi:hypothetical protein
MKKQKSEKNFKKRDFRNMVKFNLFKRKGKYFEIIIVIYYY